MNDVPESVESSVLSLISRRSWTCGASSLPYAAVAIKHPPGGVVSSGMSGTTSSGVSGMTPSSAMVSDAEKYVPASVHEPSLMSQTS
ncbi:hypothetical protein GBAR_LOCUS16443 [Geodia barretti]|uniref:Uncharacterized protein n=1 Tax=Geodia barretti TaxID=519541 RepID=A0AA35SGX2_GEOBA|nr:hypothetical protein GBAR_LOCUS16443 [Geodia barretti]